MEGAAYGDWEGPGWEGRLEWPLRQCASSVGAAVVVLEVNV